MFKVNDYVVYGLKGVCQIVSIGRDNFNKNDETNYYFLNPVSNDKMTVMVPVNNPNIMMRLVITKEDVLSLITMMPDLTTAWIDDDKQRNIHFKATLKTANPKEYVKIIKAIYLKKEARSDIGKTLPKMDEEILHTAEMHLYQEFALALNISPEEVVPYILKHIP
ncbi:MAG: CarD family transcriptional regulator [Syntrophomonadaceae bacterium]|nr:CarD family transcriptional regulator [Syntrophomonadaceae bacterium]